MLITNESIFQIYIYNFLIDKCNTAIKPNQQIIDWRMLNAFTLNHAY